MGLRAHILLKAKGDFYKGILKKFEELIFQNFKCTEGQHTCMERFIDGGFYWSAINHSILTDSLNDGHKFHTEKLAFGI